MRDLGWGHPGKASPSQNERGPLAEGEGHVPNGVIHDARGGAVEEKDGSHREREIWEDDVAKKQTDTQHRPEQRIRGEGDQILAGRKQGGRL